MKLRVKHLKESEYFLFFSAQVHPYNNSLTLVNTFGFSVVTFSGTVGGGMEPRTSSKNFQLDEDDRRTVEELRAWAACQALLSSVSAAVPLSAVQPNTYFDLICQLLAKASIDSTCTLLRVRGSLIIYDITPTLQHVRKADMDAFSGTLRASFGLGQMRPISLTGFLSPRSGMEPDVLTLC